MKQTTRKKRAPLEVKLAAPLKPSPNLGKVCEYVMHRLETVLACSWPTTMKYWLEQNRISLSSGPDCPPEMLGFLAKVIAIQFPNPPLPPPSESSEATGFPRAALMTLGYADQLGMRLLRLLNPMIEIEPSQEEWLDRVQQWYIGRFNRVNELNLDWPQAVIDYFPSSPPGGDGANAPPDVFGALVQVMVTPPFSYTASDALGVMLTV